MGKVSSKAIYLVRKGDADNAFELREMQINEPGEGDVMIETEAFGLNFADVMARKGLYREAPPMPCVVGYEVVGKIVLVGKGVSEEVIGKRVVAFLSIWRLRKACSYAGPCSRGNRPGPSRASNGFVYTGGNSLLHGELPGAG